jgi:hypothetical protein
LYFSRISFDDFIIASIISSFIENSILSISLCFSTKTWTFFRLQFFSKINWLIIVISTLCRFIAMFFASFLINDVLSKHFESSSKITA